MKRDITGKFTQSWDDESKRAVKLSLTGTAWQLLEQQASELNISRSELVERQARHVQCRCCSGDRVSQLQHHNSQLEAEIVELRRTLEELRSQEQRFSQIIDAIPHMVWTCQSNGEVEYFNQYSLDVFGITLEQLLSQGWHPLVHPDDLQRTIDAWMEAVTNETGYRIEYRLKMADASYRWYLAQALPQRNATGQINRWFGTCTDIHDRKQLEQKLQRQIEAQINERQWLEAVLNLLPTPLIFVDPEQKRVTFSNRAANAIAGVDLAQDVGATYNAEYYCTDANGQLIPPEQVPAVRAACGEKITGVEIKWHTPVGSFPLLVHADTVPAMYDRPTTSVVIFQDIQERKQIEEQLRKSQRFIQRVADATPGILYIYDLIEQRNIYANRQVGEVLGYSIEQVQAMGDRLFPTLMHPDDLATLPAHLERFAVAQDGELVEREYRMRRADGEWRWLWSRDLIFSRTPEGLPHQTLGIAHDITARKQVELLNAQLYQAEQAARAEAEASEQRFRFLAESIPQIVWVAQADGFTEYYNQRWFDYTGLTLEESQNANGSFRHPDDHDRFIAAWIDAVSHKQIFQAEQRIQRADGIYRWHLTRAYPLVDENGEIVKWFGSCTDIDDWKRMEQTQRFLAQASQTFVAARLDLQTIVNTVTQLASELTGDVCVLNLLSDDRHSLNSISFYHSSSDIRTFVGNLLERYPCRMEESLVRRVMQTGEPLRIPVTAPQELSAAIQREYRLYLKRFEVCSTLLVPLRLQGQPIGVLSLIRHTPADPHTPDELNLFQDLADRAAMAIANARLYQQAEQARQRAERANRIKDEFLAMLSHELRTPMNPILGWARLLQQGNLDTRRTAIALETIERNAKLQVQLIEDLLDISRILQGKLSLNSDLVDLTTTIQAAVETVRLAAEAKNIHIQTRFGATVGHVLGDPARLQQVLWNLLSNAVKFTPPGGQVEIQLSVIGDQPQLINEPTPYFAQLTVSDTGKGIKPEFLPYVFDTFRQADSSITRCFGGLGLGLAIARHIIELHGGTIQVTSAGEGQGATFTVQLPLVPNSIVPAQETIVDSHTLTLQGIQILAVDDEIDNLELATFILEQAGANVVAVSSAQAALQQFHQAKPDILLADIGMPQMDGYTLLQQIRTLEAEQGDRQIPAIALTAYASEMDQQQALAAGFQQHIPKPVEPELLLQTILELSRSAPKL